MSIIHVNQIKNQITKLFSYLVNISDAANGSEEHKTSLFLSRGLAAYAVHYLAEATPDVAAACIIDGGDDNGIDCIFYQEATKRLYIVQSEWIHSGSNEPDNGEIKKFAGGVRDLFNMIFERFNTKFQKLRPAIESALHDPATRYELIISHTGSNKLGIHSRRDLQDLADEMNDTSEVVFSTILNQSELHTSLTAAISGEPINLEIGLKSWGKKDSPHRAFYGQLSGRQIGDWWVKYRTRLFAQPS